MWYKTVRLTSVSYNVAGGGNVIEVTDDVRAPVSIPESTRPASVQMIAMTRPKNVLGVMSPYLQIHEHRVQIFKQTVNCSTGCTNNRGKRIPILHSGSAEGAGGVTANVLKIDDRCAA